MIGALTAAGVAVGLAWAGRSAAPGFRAGKHHARPRFPKGHIRAYDPTGQYTYADQNPALRS